MKNLDPVQNNELTKKNTGYIPRKKATQKTYDDLGFMSGLEIHQQLKTKKKLFCRCPAGIYQDFDDFDAEIVRHMRPTLSELGEYDGTALMEFKTKKEIIYRIKDETACTYDIDDTPPFPINRQALEYAIEIALLTGLNIVGEFHIARKQYLDGSIPTGFQRTGIVGIEGEIPLKNKKVRIIQMSIEEDSCREVSDVRHTRIYATDRLGMPLIETVTYPDMKHPDEVKEAAHYIRFLGRSTGKVRTGSGAARQDVNVSIEGGTRVEIKGVSSIAAIPELVHNEAFRQKALLLIKDILNERIKNRFKVNFKELNPNEFGIDYKPLQNSLKDGFKIIAINLPHCSGILSHFTQTGKNFSDEITDRLKVIACLERPNMLHSEEKKSPITEKQWTDIKKILNAKNEDAQIVIWTSDFDLKIAVETIEERIELAMNGVPNETRKSIQNGLTIFERVLPGADRMYPDTDSTPIPIIEKDVARLEKNLPVSISRRFKELTDWKIPIDSWPYLLRYNLIPMIEDIIKRTNFPPKFIATTFAHQLKGLEGRNGGKNTISTFKKVKKLFEFVSEKKLHYEIIWDMLKFIYEHPKMDFDSVLIELDYSDSNMKKILSDVPVMRDIFTQIAKTKRKEAEIDWIIGELRKFAIGNIPMNDLRDEVVKTLS